MKVLKSFLVIILLTVFSSGYSQKIYTEKDIQIVPKPVQVLIKTGVFQFSKDTKFVANGDFQKDAANALINKFETAAGWRPQITASIPVSNFIQFKVDPNLKNEAYILDVNQKSITITAKGNAGFIYGLESIRQLLPVAIESKYVVSSAKWEIPNVTITDEPRFKWRGFMIDLSRHFFDKNYIMATIDRLAMHKMNVLHLHLVDDQGWRIEIKRYPKLTEVGAWRVDQENTSWNARLTTNPDEKGTYGGFLTQEELKEIVKYAASKNIEVIPEIEMPAHVSSAIASYPELACFDQRIGVPSGGLWPITDIYCAGKETTFEFLQNVLDEVMTIFPSKYIHIGGDEATKTNWAKCPNCQKRIKDEHLKDVGELQSYFVKRIEKYINSKGKKLIGWDEILEGGVNPSATIMSWRGEKIGAEAAEKGHDVIMTPESPCYLNFYQGPQNEEPLAFDAYNPLNKVYEFDPVAAMTPSQAAHVLGGQGNLWAEHIAGPKDSEYMLFPRLAALSETLWSTKESRNWTDFTTRLTSLLKRYDYLGINYAKSAYLVTATSNADLAKKQINVTLKNEFPNPDIRYVIGDKAIDHHATKYVSPIEFKETTVFKASLFQNDKPVGKVFTDTIVFHKAVAQKVSYLTPYNQSYKGDGPFCLVNTIRGSKNFHDGQWQAWLVNDMELVVDLGKEDSIEQVILGTLESQGAGVNFPTEVKVLISNDGYKYTQVGKIMRPYAVNPIPELKDFKINFTKQNARFVKVIATNLKKSPKGESSWIFVDEVLVN